MSTIRAMHIVKYWLLALLFGAAPAAQATSGAPTTTDHVKAWLVTETLSIAPGESIWVALEFDIRAGWHTYWRNPGDSGQATQIEWHLPSGFTAGDIVWATPHRFELPPLVNYGYANHVAHLVQITAPRSLPFAATAALKAKVSWLVCADVCVPEDADLEVRLPVTASPGNADPADAALFAAARADVPSPEPAPTSAKVANGQLVISLGKAWGSTLSQIESLSFYPYDDGSIEYAAPQKFSHEQGAAELAMKIGDRAPTTGSVRGVLLATEKTGGTSSIVPIEISASLDGAHSRGSTTSSLPELILLALLGGLILNLMPCVFPVLSIKAIGLVEQAKKDPAAVRAKGLVFTAGVLSSMLALAVVLLVLRAAGQQIGWGFQLQSPLFVTLMIYLLLAVGLNLSGVFEVGGGLAGVGDNLTRGEGYRATFFTGILTTVVATPCSAPYMAAAVGAALTQSPAAALVIFAGLGLGLSLPYLLLSLAPWMRRALPKPGAWMDTVKQVFAFPMYASAAWLLWVLAQQTSSLGLGAALAGAILIALAAWCYQRSKLSGTVARGVAVAVAATALLLALLLPLRFDGPPVSARAADEWQPYDAQKVSSINAAGQPLLVNFTASWCLTCLVNERSAFADPSVQAVFRDKGVTLMKGDWTNRDPAITQALSAFGRAGVPLYVVYNSTPGSKEPVLLPQLLTAGVVHDAFAALPDRNLK